MNINRLSKRLHYGVIAIIAIVLFLSRSFFSALKYSFANLIGFNLPFLEDPTFNAPLMTDAVIWLMVLLLIVLLCLVAWSYLMSHKKRKKNDSQHHIPARKLSRGIGFMTLILLVLSFVFGSTSAIKVNNEMYDSSFWLKTSDMLIFTSLVLMFIAATAIVFSVMKNRYKSKKRTI